MTSAGLGMPTWQGVQGQQVAVCALIYFYVHGEPFNEAGPMLSRLLSYITRLILQVDVGSPNLHHFLDLLRTALEPHSRAELSNETSDTSAWINKIDEIIRESSSFSGLHSFFTKVERLLMTEELYDEIRNIVIKPAERLIDEQSPLGHYIQNCLDQYLSLEDDEFAYIVQSVQDWVEGKNKESLNETTGNSRQSSDQAVTSALRKGDYSLARAELEGFFDRSPLDWTSQSLQDTLFKNALFHYQTKAYESARASLEESLRLSRGVNDLACISACDSLLQRIDDEEIKDDFTVTSKSPSGPISFSHQSLWQVQREVDRGRPILYLLTSLSDLLRQGSEKAVIAQADQPISSEVFSECCLSLARVWKEAGITGSACAFLEAGIEESALMDSSGSTKLLLPIAILESEALTHAGKINEALALLFNPLLLQSLGMTSFTEWQSIVWKVLYKSTLKTGALEIRRAIQSIRPEVVKEVEGSIDMAWSRVNPIEEPNEVSFGRNDKITLAQLLQGQLKEASMIREEGKGFAASLTMASQVMRRAEESDLFCLYRQGVMECSESLLGLGNSTRAKEVLEDVMSQLLVEEKADLRGKAAWLYSRILLSLWQQQSERAEKEVHSVLPWLERARVAYTDSNSLKESSDVLYVQRRLYRHLDMKQEEKKAELLFNTVMQEYNNGNSERSRQLFNAVQSVVMLVGAQVVAGG